MNIINYIFYFIIIIICYEIYILYKFLKRRKLLKNIHSELDKEEIDNKLFFYEKKFFGSFLSNFFSIFIKNLSHFGGQKEELENIFYLSESMDLYSSIGFVDEGTQSIEFVAGKKQRKGFIEKNQMILHYPDGKTTNFYFFTENDESNVLLDQKEKDINVKEEIKNIQEKRRTLYKTKIMDGISKMSKGQTNIVYVAFICGCLGGFGIAIVLLLIFS